MAPNTGGRKSAKDLRNGALLQMAEAATLGLPFEVWKTRMGRFRNESTIQAFKNVYSTAGGGMNGVGAFWRGFGPKMIESATKGAVLMVSKETLREAGTAAGLSPFTAAVLGGAGGGVCQVVVMGPCTYLVTAAVTGGGSTSGAKLAKETYARSGIRGFYPGGSAIAFRQATNWASRQGLTEFVRIRMRRWKYGDDSAKLTKGDEGLCGVIGGTLSSWNHPFEVARIEMQARANAGQPAMSMVQVLGMVVREQGPLGLFQGVIPRIGLNIWQTLFMVSLVHVIGDIKK
ncbi:Mitochondrial carrier [Gracilaria domingensis]|nr:Mitochondrial carrier [Gracilaria domingensis]